MVEDDVLLLAGNLAYVSGEVAEGWRKDVVNSILFSQLYANSQVDRFAESQQWFKYYAGAFGWLKWKGGGYRFVSVGLDECVSFDLNNLIQVKLGSLVDLPQVKHFERLMYSVRQEFAVEVIASSTGNAAIFRQVEEKASTVSTVVLNVSLVGAGPAIYSVFVCFKTRQRVESDIFNQTFRSEFLLGEFGIGYSKFVLNKADYEKGGVRQKVLDSLPADTAPFVRDITPGCKNPLR